MKPIVDPDLCIGCGVCEDACPEIFQIRDDGLAYVIAEDPEPESYGCVHDSMDMCPTDAITVEE